jgi:hypothetical protein
MRDGGARIINRGLTGSTQDFSAKIAMGFQIALLPEHHKDRFARIDERPVLDLIEHLHG